jgi:hypothetical protein
MTAYRNPGRAIPTCSVCGVFLDEAGAYLDPAGNVVCRQCQARHVVGIGNQQIKAWKANHSPGMYVGAIVITALLFALGLLRYC